MTHWVYKQVMRKIKTAVDIAYIFHTASGSLSQAHCIMGYSILLSVFVVSFVVNVIGLGNLHTVHYTYFQKIHSKYVACHLLQ